MAEHNGLQETNEEILQLLEMGAELPALSNEVYKAFVLKYPEWAPYLAAADSRALSPIFEVVGELEQRLRAMPGDDHETLQEALQRLIEGMNPEKVIGMLSSANGQLWRTVYEARRLLDGLLTNPENGLGPVEGFSVVPHADEPTTVKELMAQALAQTLSFEEWGTTQQLLQACAKFVDETFWTELFVPRMLADCPEKIPVLRDMLLRSNMAEQLQSMSVLWPQVDRAEDADVEDNVED